MRIPINGHIVSDDDARIYRYYGYSVTCPADVRNALKQAPAGEDVILEINSGGGSVPAGFEIYSVLRAAARNIQAEVQSLAASAASTLMLGCRKVLLSPVAQVMIHNPACCTEGDEVVHRESLGMLASIKESILNGYELRCGSRCSREKLRNMMDDSSWLYAQEAVALGLADGILYQDGETPLAVPANIVNAAGVGIRQLAAANGLPDIAQLRAEYQRLHPEHTPALTDDWRNKARLAIENMKY